MAEDKPTFIKRILLGVSAIKKLLSDHNTDKAAHPNGFNHNITITTESEPTISLKQTSHAIGSGSTTMGTIGFTDKNDKWICFVDTECTTSYNALEVHVNNVDSPVEQYNMSTVCSFNRNKDNTCSIDLRNNRFDNVGVLNCTDRIVVRKNTEPALWLVSSSQTNGTENNGGGAILFKDKANVCLSALDTNTLSTENQFNFHLASPTSTDTSTAIPSVMRMVHDKTGVKYLDLLNNSIKRAKVSTPTSSDDKWSIVNKDYIDTALTPINSSLSGKSDIGHTHTASELGIGSFPTWTNVANVSANTTYTAQHDGYLMLGMGGGNGTYWIDTTINGTTYRWNGNTDNAYKYGWQTMQLCLPMAKGVTYSFTGSKSFFYARFVAAI